MTTKKDNREVKVLAINTLHEFAEKYFLSEREYFRQFLGKNIFKVDGSIKAKYDHERQSFTGQLPDGTWVNAHYWFNSSYKCFDIRIKICVNGGSYDDKPSTAFCQYEELTLTMFKMNEAGELIDFVNDTTWLKKRYNAAELNKVAENIKAAAKVYEAAADAMPYQFRDVYYIERLTR